MQAVVGRPFPGRARVHAEMVQHPNKEKENGT
jgi:hypothetical protein